MPWIILIVAGLLEVGWAVGLKYTEGFTRPIPTILTITSMVASLVLLGIAVRTLPLGSAYAVWTGIGTVWTAIFGMVMLGESTGMANIFCIALIIAGIIGLKILSPH